MSSEFNEIVNWPKAFEKSMKVTCRPEAEYPNKKEEISCERSVMSSPCTTSFSEMDFSLFAVDGEQVDLHDPFEPLRIDEGITLSEQPESVPLSPLREQPPSPFEEGILSPRSESGASSPSLVINSPSYLILSPTSKQEKDPRPLCRAAEAEDVVTESSDTSLDDFHHEEKEHRSQHHQNTGDTACTSSVRGMPPQERWELRYRQLLEFKKKHGHVAVPHTYPPNQQLARWVKRQRAQYKLRVAGKPSSLTDERLHLLTLVGFVWDSHDVTWRSNFDALVQFRKDFGHANVPHGHKDKKLAGWVKCQRRNYRFYWDGKPSSMTPERIHLMEMLGFDWDPATAQKKSRKVQKISPSV